MRLLATARAALALTCATALAGAPLLLPATASTERTAAPRAAAMPHIQAKATSAAVTLRGHRDLRAGAVRLSVRGASAVEFATFARGYDIEDFARDTERFFTRGDARAFKRALAKTTILGGFAPGGTGTVVLPKAGSYTAFSIGERGVIAGPTFRVGPRQARQLPDVDGQIIGKRGLAWGGSSHLPAKGSFLFKNKRTAGAPHMVVLQQVAEGTTADEVLEFLQSEEQEGPPPTWLEQGAMETGSLSPGQKLVATYDLPPGQYALLCFFPDPNMDGMPHAMMGMIKMIHLT